MGLREADLQDFEEIFSVRYEAAIDGRRCGRLAVPRWLELTGSVADMASTGIARCKGEHKRTRCGNTEGRGKEISDGSVDILEKWRDASSGRS